MCKAFLHFLQENQNTENKKIFCLFMFLYEIHQNLDVGKS